ncbi:MAG: hypothetical protein AUG89_02595 [Acidobacteria bacterium 13_1_20CM_4_56_7]|nr:MAG: hypothetical protein AUG89_02595 [Acidobacteria bacterium 13_1_20CM_4_56_7]
MSAHVRTPDRSEFDGAQTKLLREAPREVAHMPISCIYCNCFDGRIRRPQLLRCSDKPLFLHILLNSNPHARFEQTACLAARDAQSELFTNIVKVQLDPCWIAADQISEFLYTPVVTDEINSGTGDP